MELNVKEINYHSSVADDIFCTKMSEADDTSIAKSSKKNSPHFILDTSVTMSINASSRKKLP